MPTGVYTRTDYHRRRIREADNSGRFIKGHKCLAGSEKGQFEEGHTKSDDAYSFSKGSNNPRWKGGRRKHHGYIDILQPEHPFCNNRNYVFEHRLVIEQQIRRYLKPEEVTHHINKIKTDNRPENLMAFVNQSAHKRFERGGQYSESEIIFDGRKLCKN